MTCASSITIMMIIVKRRQCCRCCRRRCRFVRIIHYLGTYLSYLREAGQHYTFACALRFLNAYSSWNKEGGSRFALLHSCTSCTYTSIVMDCSRTVIITPSLVASVQVFPHGMVPRSPPSTTREWHVGLCNQHIITGIIELVTAIVRGTATSTRTASVSSLIYSSSSSSSFFCFFHLMLCSVEQTTNRNARDEHGVP